MQQSTDLQNLLHSVHRKSYPAYKSLKGSYQFDNYILSIDHVQGDPFASPSHISVRISHKTAGFPREYYSDHVTRITLSDYLTRQFEKQVSHYTFRAKGSGKSGLISVSHCGQEILERTACEITEKGITARFFIGFPANGRTINATELEKILFDFLPVCVQKAFLYRNINHKELEQTIFLAEDQTYIRSQLAKRNLVAFVADGSILPRESGISSRPMKVSIPFTSPESLRVTMDLPHKGKISGMTNFGLFVTLDGIHIDGLVHISDLGEDYFNFRPEIMAIEGERSGIRFNMGDKVSVRVARADLDTSKIDLTLISGGSSDKKRRTKTTAQTGSKTKRKLTAKEIDDAMKTPVKQEKPAAKRRSKAQPASAATSSENGKKKTAKAKTATEKAKRKDKKPSKSVKIKVKTSDTAPTKRKGRSKAK